MIQKASGGSFGFHLGFFFFIFHLVLLAFQSYSGRIPKFFCSLSNLGMQSGKNIFTHANSNNEDSII